MTTKPQGEGREKRVPKKSAKNEAAEATKADEVEKNEEAIDKEVLSSLKQL